MYLVLKILSCNEAERCLLCFVFSFLFSCLSFVDLREMFFQDSFLSRVVCEPMINPVVVVVTVAVTAVVYLGF